jgi:aspartate racemase
MTSHIGIVGCSAEGASLCYRTIVSEGELAMGEHTHPEVSMHTPSLSDYVECLQANDMDGIGDLMLASAHKLANIGADFLICPDNTVHQAFDYVAARSPLPWLHIADVVTEEAKARGFRCAGLTGTKWLVESSVYPAKLEASDIACQRPETDDLDLMNRLIMEELTKGIFSAPAIASFQDIILRLKEKGCDSVILGCTEIPLIIDDENSGLPTLDSTRLLARAAVKQAVQDFR